MNILAWIVIAVLVIGVLVAVAVIGFVVLSIVGGILIDRQVRSAQREGGSNANLKGSGRKLFARIRRKERYRQ